MEAVSSTRVSGRTGPITIGAWRFCPPKGGTIRTRYRRVEPVHEDSTDVMEAPALTPKDESSFTPRSLDRLGEVGHFHTDAGIRG